MKLYFLAPFIFQKLIWIPTRLILTIFGRISIRGLDNLAGIRDKVIFACNHSSEIDPFIVPASLPFWSRWSPLFYATREKSFYDNHGWRRHLFGGRFINLWGGYSVHAGLHDYEKSLVDHIHIARDGGNLCVYPEGGISPDGTIQPARGGVAYLAERARYVIVPVGISGVYNTPFTDFFLRKKRISVHFGKPITQDELREQVSKKIIQGVHIYKAQANYVMRKVGELVEKRKLSEDPRPIARYARAV